MRTIIDMRILTILLTLFFMTGCKNMYPDVFLPDGTNLKGLKVKDIKDKYRLRFNQYAGFQGDTNSGLLRSFVVLTKSIPPSDVLTEEEITELEEEIISGIVFEKIPGSKDSNDVLKDIQSAYAADYLEQTATGESKIIKAGLVLGTVRFVPHGGPGYLVQSP